MKTFLLGVGCQKGGTTWLHRYLSDHPSCDFGFRKEYHIFDALWVRGAKTHKFYQKALADLARSAKEASISTTDHGLAFKPKLLDAQRLVSFYTDVQNYAAYFDSLHSTSSEVGVVGDITPSYNGLSSGNFLRIREMLEARGFRVKVIFLMRDPVERIYSSTRMRIRDQQDKPEKSGKDPVLFFNKRFAWKDVEIRTRYENTLKSLDYAFKSEDVLYGFYESLFCEPEVRRITEFLGIDYTAPNFGTQVNASPRTANLDAESIAKVRSYYDDTYLTCMNRFGKEYVQSIWPHA